MHILKGGEISSMLVGSNMFLHVPIKYKQILKSYSRTYLVNFSFTLNGVLDKCGLALTA